MYSTVYPVMDEPPSECGVLIHKPKPPVISGTLYDDIAEGTVGTAGGSSIAGGRCPYGEALAITDSDFPTELFATRTNLYEVPISNPVTVVVNVFAAISGRTIYVLVVAVLYEMVYPSSFVPVIFGGTSHERVTFSTPGVAKKATGASGTVAGVASTIFEASL